LTLSRLIISTALALMSLASIAQSQDVISFDRSSFGKAVWSQTESTVADIQLELSVGEYKNEPINRYSKRSEIVQFGRSVGRLDVLTDKGIHRCTAFIVSKQYILTNYHCTLGVLENARIDATRIDAITFVAGYTQTGVEEGTRKYTVNPKPIEASKELDYAVLEVVGDPSQEYGELKLASLAPQAGDPFWIIGHPMGEGQRVSREKCGASTPAVSAGKLLHTCDTLPGNSGSPVIDVSLRQVVALHHAGSQKDSVNFAILMSEILEHSTVLAAYKAPDAAPKSQPLEPKTAANSVCDALYSEAKEAKACYAYKAYLNSCSNHFLAPIAEGYIKEFCQPQETVKRKSNDALLSGSIEIQTPACPETGYKHECFGSSDILTQICRIKIFEKVGGYTGWFENNKPSGLGRFRQNEGVIYEGAWKKGNPHGQGKMGWDFDDPPRWEYSGRWENGDLSYGEYIDPNGKETYVGSFLNCEPHGDGTFNYADQTKYIGEFKEGLEHGQGQLLSVDNIKIREGIWENGDFKQATKACDDDPSLCSTDQLCGQSLTFKSGKAAWRNGNISYVAEAKRRGLSCGVTEVVATPDGLPACPADQSKRYHNCFGTYRYANGDKYVGSFRAGKPNGQGRLELAASGNVYEGMYKDGSFDGQGTYTFANGDTYVGMFENDMFNGEGTLDLISSGNKYTGQYEDDLFQGQGTYIYANGDKYVGEFQDGAQHGQGTKRFASGDIYDGAFKDDRFEGQGEYIWASGARYVGAWDNDQRTGKGTYFYVDGRKYVGLWKQDQRHGQGSYSFANGNVYIGKWKDDQRDGLFKVKYGNGNTYIGGLKNSCFHGRGKYIFADGTIMQGLWKNCELVD
jgi:V8-like Glu-specific endopeptidase